MKNIYKISVIVFLSFTMIISSCKKEEIIVEGCTDSSAMNYSSNATSNDGSCVYAYDIAQGDWDIAPACDDIIFFGFPIPLDSLLPKTIQINGEEDGVISLDINGNSILADVANNGEVNIQEDQTIGFDTEGFDPTGGLLGIIAIKITGSGTIFSNSNGDFLLNLSNQALGIDADCEITFLR